jgi:hypothetical protein
LKVKQNDDSGEENAQYTTQFKGKCKNCDKVGHKAAKCKSKQVKTRKMVLTAIFVKSLVM